jgi:hypothetical protein
MSGAPSVTAITLIANKNALFAYVTNSVMIRKVFIRFLFRSAFLRTTANAYFGWCALLGHLYTSVAVRNCAIRSHSTTTSSDDHQSRPRFVDYPLARRPFHKSPTKSTKSCSREIKGCNADGRLLLDWRIPPLHGWNRRRCCSDDRGRRGRATAVIQGGATQSKAMVAHQRATARPAHSR